jgi:hypothetical protein
VRGAALALLLLPAPLAAQDEATELATLRLATCAALWQGYADVLGDEEERVLAARFRDAAARLAGAEEADALIAERRPWMVDLLAAFIHAQDDQSRELFQRLVTDCGRIQADLDEIGR